MIRSPGFGSRGNDFFAEFFRTRFRVGSGCFSLTVPPLPLSRRLILQQARGQFSPPTACQHTVSCSLSLPIRGFFSPFLRSTISLSVTQEYLALRGGPRGFTRDFSCPVLLGIQLVSLSFRLQDFHLLWCIIPMLRLTARVHIAVPQPQW